MTSVPNVYDTPRSFSAQPEMSRSGSDHRVSQSRPVSGTSIGRETRFGANDACECCRLLTE